MRKKLDSIQALRALAFLGVFLAHCDIQPYLGKWGVSVFFILSGFLMVYAYCDRIEGMECSWKANAKFAIRKIGRLYPLHIIMTFITLPIKLIKMKLGMTALTIPQLSIQFLLQGTLLQTWIPVSRYYYSLNGLSWYLSVSLFLYFAFPWIMRGIRKTATGHLIGIAVSLWGVLWGAAAFSELFLAGNVSLRTYLTYGNAA